VTISPQSYHRSTVEHTIVELDLIYLLLHFSLLMHPLKIKHPDLLDMVVSIYETLP